MVKLHSLARLSEEKKTPVHSRAARARIRILLTYFSRLSRTGRTTKGNANDISFYPGRGSARHSRGKIALFHCGASNSADCIPRGARKHEGRSADCFFTTMLSNRGENFCLAQLLFVRHRARFGKLPDIRIRTSEISSQI